ncbi:hypothetical protein [Streptomyces sp. TBY4]|uniref:hypothetical protein n=1 Tax=Streptomyces sp. TBY4 TaxID=2962030 RepID=UPI0020B8BADE|nr:hypothetical protein [Streptomyces sp. TBY4]MCP3753789.1 hypothetical protein [Streptomyces sp. TBY4]
MNKKSLRHSVLAKALVPGALIALTVPEIAYADVAGVTVTVPEATMGPATTFTGVSSRADCADGLVSGGGVNQTIGTDSTRNGNHVLGMAPSPDGLTEYTESPGVVAADVRHWLAFGGSGGNAGPAFSTTAYAVCLSTPRIRHTQVVMNQKAGPTAPQSSEVVVATCPAGTMLLGGGVRNTPASVGSLKPVGSFPTFNDAAHDFGRKPAAEGEVNPDSWTAVGGIGGGHGNNGNTTFAYAICTGDRVNVRGMSTKVHFREVTGPTGPGTGRTATVGCADDNGQDRSGRGRHGEQGDKSLLISGGAAASGGDVTTKGFTKAGSGGTHLNGSFPSDSDGNPVGNGSTTAASWTANIHAGGSPSPNTYTDVWALCLDLRGHRQ